jgi:uncharacterized membrane protein YkvA (DUF1232 family)
MDKVLDGEILAPEDEAERSDRVRRRFWTTFVRAARYIPFADDVVAAFYCAIDPATPARVRGTLLAALAYFVLPADAIPDIFAGIGFSDDVTVLLAAIAMVGAHITESHREAARRVLSGNDAAGNGRRG